MLKSDEIACSIFFNVAQFRAQFGFQIFQTFAQNCLKLGAAGMTGNGQDASCEKYCVCSAIDAAAPHDDRSIQKRGAFQTNEKMNFVV